VPDRRAEEPQPDPATGEPRPAAPDHGGRPITDRELEVLTHAARGRTNREIGAALGISPMTVRNHMRTIQRKLATTDRTQAVVMAIGSGWIPIRIVLPHEVEDGAPGVSLVEPNPRPAEAQ
jgi:DNA-binding CsgD family transcriptional regulator